MATQVAISVPSKRLAVSITSTTMTFQLNNILSWKGLQDGTTALTSADFGTRAFGVFRNSANTQIEFFEWDPSTIASASITIISRGLSYNGGTTANATTAYGWNGNETIVELGGNLPQLFEQYIDKTSDESIDGVKTFTSSPIVPTPGSATQVANKAYVDAATTAGGADASTIVKGISRASTDPTKSMGTATMTVASPCVVTFASHGLTAGDSIKFTTSGALPTGVTSGTTYYVISAGLATNTFEISATFGGTAINTSGSQSGTHTLYRLTPYFVGDNDSRVPTSSQASALASTTTPGSGNKYITQTDFQKSAEVYALTTGSANAYVATYTPVPSLTIGMRLTFKANFTNTGAATLNPNSLGATAIKKLDGTTALVAGDIVSGQIVEVEYDGTNFQMVSPVGNLPYPTATTLIPKPEIVCSGAVSATISSNTTASVGKINVTNKITVNQISIQTGTSGAVSGTVKIGLYSEDGQTQLFNVTTATLNAISTTFTTALGGATTITPGLYYVVIVPVGTTNVDLMFYSTTTTNSLNTLFNSVTSKPVSEGTLTVSASTLPSTFTPSSITAATTKTLIFRLD